MWGHARGDWEGLNTRNDREQGRGQQPTGQCGGPEIIPFRNPLVRARTIYEVASSPVGGAIVAVVGQEVIVEFPEDVEGDSPVGR